MESWREFEILCLGEPETPTVVLRISILLAVSFVKTWVIGVPKQSRWRCCAYGNGRPWGRHCGGGLSKQFCLRYATWFNLSIYIYMNFPDPNCSRWTHPQIHNKFFLQPLQKPFYEKGFSKKSINPWIQSTFIHTTFFHKFKKTHLYTHDGYLVDFFVFFFKVGAF